MSKLSVCFSLQAIIILSTAFLGALLFTNGLDYYVEKGRVVTFTVRVLQGNPPPPFYDLFRTNRLMVHMLAGNGRFPF